MTEETLFTEALEKHAPESRAAYIQAACGADEGLRQRVEALLKSHQEAQGFLSHPPVGPKSNGHLVASVMTESPDDAVDGRIGNYKLLQKLGEGGMGVVWAAEQSVPVKRRVALKVIKPGMDSRKVIARLEAERQALALMDHTNIAKVFDAGATPAGRPYFVMELVRGLPISKYCDEMQLSLRDRLDLFLPVCYAIQHAHQKGIIHRDIKPSNVLVAVEDGKPMPKVIDFGVAKALHQRLTDESVYTEIGQVIGTLEYMSPEQAELSALDVDTRADIYALGAMLYELLTGTTPLDKPRLQNRAYPEMLRMIREQEPVTPSTRLSRSKESLTSVASLRRTEPARLAHEMRGDLDWIVMKCLEKDRTRRYPTVDALALDVQRYLKDEPVEARPPSRAYRARKFLRRHAAAMWTLAVCLTLLVGGLVTSTIQAVRATRAEGKMSEEAAHAWAAERQADQDRQAADVARQDEAKQRGIAERSERLARRRLYASQINLAYEALRDGGTARALELLEGLRPQFDEEDLRTFEWYHLWNVCHRGRLMTWSATNGQITDIEFSNDGRTVATSGWAGVRVWDLDLDGRSAKLRRFLGLGSVWAIAFSPDDKTLVTGGVATLPKSVRRWNVDTWQEQGKPLQLSGGARGVTVSSDGKLLAAGGGIDVKLWDLDTGRELFSALDSVSRNAVAISPDGKTVVMGCDPGIVRVWVRTEAGWRKRFELKGHTDPIHSLALSPDGKLLASCAREVKLWDPATGTEIATFQAHNSLVSDVKFSPDGKTLATAADDRYVRLWNVETRKEQTRYAHLAPVSRLAFSKVGRLLVSGCSNGSVHVWDLAAPAASPELRHPGAVAAAEFSGAEKLITTGAGKARIWDTSAGKQLPRFEGPQDPVAIAPDQTTMASIVNSFVILRDARTGRVKGSLEIPFGNNYHYHRPSHLNFSPDGKFLAMWNPASDGMTSVFLWDLESQTLRAELNPQPRFDVYRPRAIAFSPDGKTVAIGYAFWWVLLYDTATGKPKQWITQEREALGIVGALAYSPDGKLLATGMEKGTVRLWDHAAGQLVVALKGHTAAVRSIAFSPDGGTVATAADDGTVRMWSAVTGQERLTLTGHAGPVTAVSFAPDGRVLVSAGADGVVKLWRAPRQPEATAPKSDLDREDPSSALGLVRAGEHFEQAGLPTEAEEAFRKAIARFEKLERSFPQEPAYWDYQVDTRWKIGMLYEKRGDRDRAVNLYEEALTMQHEKLAADDPDIAVTEMYIGRNLVTLEKFTEAVPHLRIVYEIYARHRPETYEQYRAQHLLGHCLLAEKKYAEAESLLLEAYNGLTARQLVQPVVAPGHLQDVRRRLAELYEARGEAVKAAEWRKQEPPR